MLLIIIQIFDFLPMEPEIWIGFAETTTTQIVPLECRLMTDVSCFQRFSLDKLADVSYSVHGAGVSIPACDSGSTGTSYLGRCRSAGA